MVDKLDYKPQLDLEAWAEIDDLVYEKQLIYVDKFVKDEGDGQRQEFEVTPSHVYHWAHQGNVMLERGIKIPMPKGHTGDPEAKRAEVTRFVAKEDEKGRLSLYAICRFKDHETAEQLKAANVSIEAVREFTDGKGRKYKWPILHVAFTDYPVIPDLGPFQAVAASMLDLDINEENVTMNEELAGLLEEFGITAEEGWTDTEAADAIRSFVAQLQADAEAGAEASEEEEMLVSHDDGDGQLSASFKVPAGVLKLAKSGREAVIDGMLTAGKILPPQVSELKKRFCSDAAISLSINGDDGFDSTVAILQKGQAIRTGEQTGPQGGSVMALAHGRGSGEKPNPLVERARRRREEYEKKQGRR